MAEEHGPKIKNEPRRSWMMRKRQERAAMKEGLAEWQANPYFCAGRVTVPALMDTVACQCFINTSASPPAPPPPPSRRPSPLSHFSFLTT